MVTAPHYAAGLAAMHAKRRANRVVVSLICASCAQPFTLLPGQLNTRLKISVREKLCCSRSCARKNRMRIAPVQQICVQCHGAFALPLHESRHRKERADSGLIFCGRSCSAQYFYPSNRQGMLVAIVLKRQPHWSDEQYHWEQILHDLGLGINVAVIPNSFALVVLEIVHVGGVHLSRSGRWWEVGIRIDDGVFGSAVNPISCDDGHF